jgi:hypothetical protein
MYCRQQRRHPGLLYLLRLLTLSTGSLVLTTSLNHDIRLSRTNPRRIGRRLDGPITLLTTVRRQQFHLSAEISPDDGIGLQSLYSLNGGGPFFSGSTSDTTTNPELWTGRMAQVRRGNTQAKNWVDSCL